MTDVEAFRLMGKLVAAFPRPTVSEMTLDVYVEHLLPLDYAQAAAAIRRLTVTAKFLPTIAEIREAVTANATSEWPTPGDAWARVMHLIRKVGSYGTLPTQTPFDRMVKRCIEGIGGWAYLCEETENVMADRAHFLRVYEQNVARERQRDAAEVWPLPGPEARPALDRVPDTVVDLITRVTRSAP